MRKARRLAPSSPRTDGRSLRADDQPNRRGALAQGQAHPVPNTRVVEDRAWIRRRFTRVCVAFGTTVTEEIGRLVLTWNRSCSESLDERLPAGGHRRLVDRPLEAGQGELALGPGHLDG